MKKICIAIISIALIIAFGISLNNVEKTELQSTDGRDFEKATVTEIVSSDYSDSTSKDYDGSVGEDDSVRAGQQQIKVKKELVSIREKFWMPPVLHRICMVPDVE